MAPAFTETELIALWVMRNYITSLDTGDRAIVAIYNHLFPFEHTSPEILAADVLVPNTPERQRIANDVFDEILSGTEELGITITAPAQVPFPDVPASEDDELNGSRHFTTGGTDQRELPVSGNERAVSDGESGDEASDSDEPEAQQPADDTQASTSNKPGVTAEEKNSSSEDSGRHATTARVPWTNAARRALHILRNVRHRAPDKIEWGHYSRVLRDVFPKQLSGLEVPQITKKCGPLVTELGKPDDTRYNKWREVIPDPADDQVTFDKKQRAVDRVEQRLRASERRLGLPVGGPNAKTVGGSIKTGTEATEITGKRKRDDDDTGDSDRGAQILLDAQGKVIDVRPGAQQTGSGEQQHLFPPGVNAVTIAEQQRGRHLEDRIVDYVAEHLNMAMTEQLITDMLSRDTLAWLGPGVIQASIENTRNSTGQLDIRDALEAIDAHLSTEIEGRAQFDFELIDVFSAEQSPLHNFQLAAQAFQKPWEMVHNSTLDRNTTPGKALAISTDAQPLQSIAHHTAIYKHMGTVERITLRAQDGNLTGAWAQLEIEADVQICDVDECSVCGNVDATHQPAPGRYPQAHIKDVADGDVFQPTVQGYAPVDIVEHDPKQITFWDGMSRPVFLCSEGDCDDCGE